MGVNRICLSIESRMENVRLVGAAVNRLCGLTSLSEAAAHRVELCVTEAVVNCIKHAYGSKPDGPISTTFSLRPGELVITVTDQGASMDPLQIPSLTIPGQRNRNSPHPSPTAESGRGLTIISGFMDHVTYRLAGNRNHLTMRKRIAEREKQEP